MKRILYLFMTCLVMASCKKESFVSVFDQKPEERMAESIGVVNTILTSAPNGWVATLPTNAGGAYGFYMTFGADQNVTMYGDLNDNTATTLRTSTFRIKGGLGAELIFDTYNHISMLADPNASSFGGVTGTGYKSDVEFTYVRSTADSIIFVGKAYRQPFAMVKATAAQKTAYTSGGLKASSDKLKSFFATTQNAYIDVTSGSTTLKVGLSVNFTNVLASGKRVSLTGLLTDGSVASAVNKIAITADGISMTSPGLVYQGITFVKFAWKDATTLAMYDSANKEYIVKSNPVPLTPLPLLFGFPSSYTYRKITISSTGLPPGVTSKFTAVYNEMVTKFGGGGRTIASTTFALTSNSVFEVTINYVSSAGAAFVASAAYGYTRNGDVITLDNNPVGNVNWPTRAAEIKPLADYMLTGPFRIDWASSTTPNVGLLGGLYRTADASSFIYGTL